MAERAEFQKQRTSERRYRDAREMVDVSPEILSGTPVIKGTRIPVHDIAASVEAGCSVQRILAAYPGLVAEQIDLAVVYAEAHPPPNLSSTRPMLDGLRLISEKRVPWKPEPE